VTYPSHTTIVTGRAPADHGIFANTLFDPEQRTNGAWFWYTEQIKVPTLWDAAKAAGLTTAAVSWPVTVGARIDFNFPEFRETRTEEDRMLYRTLATPGLLREFEKEHPSLTIMSESDEGRARAASFLIRTRQPNLLLLHIFDLDDAQHAHGPGSPESFAALEGNDQYIGWLRKEVEAAGLADSTRWIITSDHGFFPVEKAFQATAFLASLGLTAEEGKPATWKVAAHVNGGSIAFVSKDPNDHESQSLVERNLERLKQDGNSGIDRVFTRADLNRMRAYPHAFLAVSLSSNFMGGVRGSGPWVTSSGATRGTHGFAPGPEALDSTFIAFGPGIPAERLPRGELKDVAKTAAALLGFKLPSAEGKDLLAP
jgi:predicted AlkP superfamily pyrophosphatase or phosphodiesterase